MMKGFVRARAGGSPSDGRLLSVGDEVPPRISFEPAGAIQAETALARTCIQLAGQHGRILPIPAPIFALIRLSNGM
jgi:hypothetical protein